MQICCGQLWCKLKTCLASSASACCITTFVGFCNTGMMSQLVRNHHHGMSSSRHQMVAMMCTHWTVLHA